MDRTTAPRSAASYARELRDYIQKVSIGQVGRYYAMDRWDCQSWSCLAQPGSTDNASVVFIGLPNNLVWHTRKPFPVLFLSESSTRSFIVALSHTSIV